MDASRWLECPGFVILLALSEFVSSTETAVSSLSALHTEQPWLES